ncbi:MAG: hypothetical protein ABIH66_01710 [bacterium]
MTIIASRDHKLDLYNEQQRVSDACDEFATAIGIEPGYAAAKNDFITLCGAFDYGNLIGESERAGASYQDEPGIEDDETTGGNKLIDCGENAYYDPSDDSCYCDDGYEPSEDGKVCLKESEDN